MAGGFETDCPDCGHHWEGVLDSLRIGPSFWYGESLRNGRNLFCPRCCHQLYYPTSIDRTSWRKWHEQVLASIAGDPTSHEWLRSLLDRIDNAFASKPWYVPSHVNLANVRCPDCSDVMISVDERPHPLICPACGSDRPRLPGLTSLCTLARAENLFS